MDEYISERNQRVLWNTIQRVQLLHERIPTTHQQAWFRRIIGKLYQENQASAIQLKELNKITIRYMIQTLKSTGDRDRDRDNENDNEKRIQTGPKFSEDKDDVIENMSDLLQQQMKQRELDVMTNPMEHIAELKLEMKNLSEKVRQLSDELSIIKSASKSQETA